MARTISMETIHAFTAESDCARRARRVCRVRPRARRRPGDQGRHRHLRLDRLCPADSGEPGRHLQEERSRRTIKKIPQKDRHLAIASGDIQCAATTVETWIVWNANGVATKQIFQLDKSYGADGMAVRNDIASIKDLKGKTVAASAPGTAPYFTLAWFLKKNGLSVKDVTVVNLEPAAAAQAFVAGQNDAAMTYEPYLSTVRAAPDKGKIIATTLDYPMIMDTVRLHAQVPGGQPEGRQGARRQLLRGRRHDREGAGQGLSRSWAPT